MYEIIFILHFCYSLSAHEMDYLRFNEPIFRKHSRGSSLFLRSKRKVSSLLSGTLVDFRSELFLCVCVCVSHEWLQSWQPRVYKFMIEFYSSSPFILIPVQILWLKTPSIFVHSTVFICVCIIERFRLAWRLMNGWLEVLWSVYKSLCHLSWSLTKSRFI